MQIDQETYIKQSMVLRELLSTKEKFEIAVEALIESNRKMTVRDFWGAQESLNKALSKIFGTDNFNGTNK